jgi:hypothetical protein
MSATSTLVLLEISHLPGELPPLYLPKWWADPVALSIASLPRLLAHQLLHNQGCLKVAVLTPALLAHPMMVPVLPGFQPGKQAPSQKRGGLLAGHMGADDF